jgi:SHS2 domain-containing protein
MFKMTFRILPHTSELELEIKAKTKKMLFKEAINVLSKILGETTKDTKPIFKTFQVSQKEKNETILLINLLNKILTSSHIHKKIYVFSSFLEFSPQKVKVITKSYKVKNFKEDLKALTFHKSEIKKNKNFWKVNLIFDI